MQYTNTKTVIFILRQQSFHVGLNKNNMSLLPLIIVTLIIATYILYVAFWDSIVHWLNNTPKDPHPEGGNGIGGW